MFSRTSLANATGQVSTATDPPYLRLTGLLLGDADGPSFQTEMAAGKCGTAGRELGENVLHKYMYI